jgi:predicted dehydrogenase
MKELRIGIIGTGAIANLHAKVWDQVPGVTLVAGCDIDKAKLETWGAQYGIKDLYTDFRQLLARDDIDAVDVCVHNNLHTPISIAVMKSGKHCYSEKPMAGSYVDAKILYEAATQYGVKLAIQCSSLFNNQTRIAKKYIEGGKLGKIYHVRSISHRRVGRPGVDFPLSTDFYSKEIGGHGPMFDIGVYHISQMLYLLGMPKLESVYGVAHNEFFMDERLLKGKKYDVEDLGVGLARYKGGLSMDLYHDWALNMDEIGNCIIAGSMGGLKLINIDVFGGRIPNPELYSKMHPELEFYGIEDGLYLDKKLNCAMNEHTEQMLDPNIIWFDNNQYQWAAYLRGELTDETRINTPWITLNTMLVSEGIFLSDKLGRSVTAEEIDAMSESTAIRRQETPWGVFEYEF